MNLFEQISKDLPHNSGTPYRKIIKEVYAALPALKVGRNEYDTMCTMEAFSYIRVPALRMPVMWDTLGKWLEKDCPYYPMANTKVHDLLADTTYAKMLYIRDVFLPAMYLAGYELSMVDNTLTYGFQASEEGYTPEFTKVRTWVSKQYHLPVVFRNHSKEVFDFLEEIGIGGKYVSGTREYVVDGFLYMLAHFGILLQTVNHFRADIFTNHLMVTTVKGLD